ncbi:ejaculatory bulb-specific protein 1-like [Homarus americanus]|uniref:ejaculatory bulb-specific protein 1-like n=1 Tax=Homarus americanus TaxID=6706 RepID=UPI001C46A23F|nr:ejaculatory bulb-specific protein 1-like [Homarus americanus]
MTMGGIFVNVISPIVQDAKITAKRPCSAPWGPPISDLPGGRPKGPSLGVTGAPSGPPKPAVLPGGPVPEAVARKGISRVGGALLGPCQAVAPHGGTLPVAPALPGAIQGTRVPSGSLPEVVASTALPRVAAPSGALVRSGGDPGETSLEGAGVLGTLHGAGALQAVASPPRLPRQSPQGPCQSCYGTLRCQTGAGAPQQAITQGSAFEGSP